MTLNVTIANPWFVAQVADRRLTVDGRTFDDEANKANVLCCRDALLTVTYTGLGYFNEWPLDDWITETFERNKAARHDMGWAVKLLAQQAMETFQRQLKPIDQAVGHTFVVAGWQRKGKRDICYLWLVSNCEDDEGHRIDPPRDHFRLRWIRMPRSAPLDTIAMYVVTGTEAAVDLDAVDEIARAVLGERQPEPIVERMVSLVRQAADHPDYGRHIGKDCMAIVLPRHGMGPLQSEYFPAREEPIAYTPQVVTAGTILSGGEIVGQGLSLRCGDREFHIAGSKIPPDDPHVILAMRSKRRPPRPGSAA